MGEVPTFEAFEDFASAHEEAGTGVDNLVACYISHQQLDFGLLARDGFLKIGRDAGKKTITPLTTHISFDEESGRVIQYG